MLSALGMGLADTAALREQSVVVELSDDAMPRLHAVAADLETEARAELRDEDIPDDRIVVARSAHLRYDGTDTSVPVPLADPATMTAEFEAVHRRTYSFLMDRPLIVDAVAVEATGLTRRPDLTGLGAADGGEVDGGEVDGAADGVPMFVDGVWRDVPLHRREHLAPGTEVAGPAIVAEDLSTTVIENGWSATISEHGHLVLERHEELNGADVGTEADPVLLEIFNNLFMSIAEQMGTTLESTAQSVNIKERLEFSCALFDPDGNSVANAPHIPVHLGSMGTSVQEIVRRRADSMKPGDVYAVNDPYHGGTHLPDITVVTPVFDTGNWRHPVPYRIARASCRNRWPDTGFHASEQPRHP